MGPSRAFSPDMWSPRFPTAHLGPTQVTGAGKPRGPPHPLPPPQTDTATCRGTGLPVGWSEATPTLPRPGWLVSVQGEALAWISGSYAVPHTSFNQGTNCTSKDMGQGDTAQDASPAGVLHPCPQLQKSKPHRPSHHQGQQAQPASFRLGGAPLLPRAHEDLLREASYPAPVTALN